MNDKDRTDRHRAAHEFRRSLDELKTIWQPESAASESAPEPPAPPPARPNTQSHSATHKRDGKDWEDALEDAARDIENFMTHQHEGDP